MAGAEPDGAGHDKPAGGRSLRKLLLPGLLALGFTAYFWFLGVARWNAGLVTSYDLGIFSQSALSYAAGQLPVSHIRSLNLLGDHFSPINALLGLAWLAWPDPRVLILVQSVGLGAAVAGLVWWAARDTAGRPGLRWFPWLIAAVALLSRGVLASALFDFHEVAFAAPTVVALCYALRRGNFSWVVALSILLVLTKEDLGFTVIGAAIAMFLMGRSPAIRRPSVARALRDPAATYRLSQVLVVVGIGVLGVLVASLTIAHFNPTGRSPYVDMVLGIFSNQDHPCTAELACGFQASRRLMPLALVVVASLFIGFRSPLILVALPTVAWRVVSSNTSYWSIDFHYDLVPGLAAMCAAVDIAPRLFTGRLPRTTRLPVVVAVVVAAVLSAVLGVQSLVNRFPPMMAKTPPADRVHNVKALVNTVPAGSRVAALNSVGPYAIPRLDVYRLVPQTTAPVRYLLYTTDQYWTQQFSTCLRQAVAAANGTGGRVVKKQGDVVLVDLGREEPVTQVVQGLCPAESR